MSKFCPSCGEELVDNAKFCKNCGINLENLEPNRNADQFNTQRFQSQTVEKDHTLAIVLGYACAVLLTLVGIIFGVYLLTRKDSNRARKHGTYIIIVSVGMFLFSALFL